MLGMAKLGFSKTASGSLPIVATPTFDPNGGVNTAPVTIACTTVGADIWYTTNGDTPVVGVSTQYTTPIVLDPTYSGSIKAIASKIGFTDSEIAISSLYTVVPLISAVTPVGGPLGIGATIYITGYNLGDATHVFFGATEWPFTSQSNSELDLFGLYNASYATVDVTLTTPEGSTTKTDAFTYYEQPTGTLLTPAVIPGTPAGISIGATFSSDAIFYYGVTATTWEWADPGPSSGVVLVQTFGITPGSTHTVTINDYGGSWVSPAILETGDAEGTFRFVIQGAAASGTYEFAGTTYPIYIEVAPDVAGDAPVVAGNVLYTTNGTDPVQYGTPYSGSIPMEVEYIRAIISIPVYGSTIPSTSSEITLNVVQAKSTLAITPDSGFTGGPSGAPYSFGFTGWVGDLEDNQIWYQDGSTADPIDPPIYGSLWDKNNPVIISGGSIGQNTAYAVALASGYTYSDLVSVNYVFSNSDLPQIAPSTGTYADVPVTFSGFTAPGATVVTEFYWNDGTTPSFTQWDGSTFALDNLEYTFNVYSMISGYQQSPTATSTVHLKCAEATASVPSGTYKYTFTVYLNVYSPSYTVYYSLDDGMSWAVYDAGNGILVADSCTLQTYATYGMYAQSDTSTYIYTIDLYMDAPTLTDNGSTLSGTGDIIIIPGGSFYIDNSINGGYGDLYYVISPLSGDVPATDGSSSWSEGVEFAGHTTPDSVYGVGTLYISGAAYNPAGHTYFAVTSGFVTLQAKGMTAGDVDFSGWPYVTVDVGSTYYLEVLYTMASGAPPDTPTFNDDGSPGGTSVIYTGAFDATGYDNFIFTRVGPGIEASSYHITYVGI